MNNKKQVFQSSILVAVFSLVLYFLICGLTIFPELILSFIGGVLALVFIGFYIILAVAYLVHLFLYVLQLLGIKQLFHLIVKWRQAKKRLRSKKPKIYRK
jgi:hypothetical protein